MLDGVQEHFTKGNSNCVFLAGREIRHLVNELEQPVGRAEIAASEQANPFRGGREDFNSFILNGTRRCRAQHFRECGHRVGFGKITERALAHGGNHVSRRALVGQNDKPRMRADQPDLAQ
jgi:hypothetical protein